MVTEVMCCINYIGMYLVMCFYELISVEASSIESKAYH